MKFAFFDRLMGTKKAKKNKKDKKKKKQEEKQEEKASEEGHTNAFETPPKRSRLARSSSSSIGAQKQWQ